MKQERCPGGPRSTTGGEKGYEPDPYSANSNRSLGVARCFDEQTLADKVAWQTIGLPKPVIKIPAPSGARHRRC
jgi:hypothetical protein